jgi:hypothetical protein
LRNLRRRRTSEALEMLSTPCVGVRCWRVTRLGALVPSYRRSGHHARKYARASRLISNNSSAAPAMSTRPQTGKRDCVTATRLNRSPAAPLPPATPPTTRMRHQYPHGFHCVACCRMLQSPDQAHEPRVNPSATPLRVCQRLSPAVSCHLRTARRQSLAGLPNRLVHHNNKFARTTLGAAQH